MGNTVAVEVAADTAAVEVVIIMVVAIITSTVGSHGTVITTEAVEVVEVMENEDSELEVKVAEEIGEINKSHEFNLPAELNSPFIHRIIPKPTTTNNNSTKNVKLKEAHEEIKDKKR